MDTISKAYSQMLESKITDIQTELKLGDTVRIRDHNKTTYGRVGIVMGITENGIHVGNRWLMTLPYDRKYIEPISPEEFRNKPTL